MSLSNTTHLHTVEQHWQEQWENALSLWSRFTRLRPPHFCHTRQDANAQGLTDSFAMIRFHDQSIVINLADIVERGLTGYALEILAHEIGHHVLVPANLTDHARLIARIRKGLPTLEAHAPMIANLYTDLLINDHLQRSARLRMDQVFQCLQRQPSTDRLWALYMRIYEMLWQLSTGTLGGRSDSDGMEGDAWLGARLIRVYARDWQAGAGGFAALLLPYLVDNKNPAHPALKGLMDTRQIGHGGFPSGLVTLDDDEMQEVLHPALDPRIAGVRDKAPENSEKVSTEPAIVTPPQSGAGQCREPFEYGAILRASGIELSDHDIAIRYYRERALPHLVKFPGRRRPHTFDTVPEGTILWEPGEPLENIDWFQTLMESPVVIPGITTRQRVWGQEPSPLPRNQPVDLDLYVDCSGSMPNPQAYTSYTALAGAILCVSALRAGACVQVTLWSGAGQFTCTPGFIRDETAILRVLTGYFGGATAFPIHVLRDTYGYRSNAAPDGRRASTGNGPQRRPGPTGPRGRSRDAHIVVLSDDGVTTMFDNDELGNSGWQVAAHALARARAGGTLVLNLPVTLDPTPQEAVQQGRYWQSHLDTLRRARDEQGWAVHRVTDWADMIAFAQAFSRQHYHPPEAA